MALKTLFQNIAKLGISKKIINSSIAGLNVAELNFSEIKDYPLLFTTTNGAHRVGKNITTYSVSIYYIDRLMENRDNDMDVISNSMDILKHFVDSLKELDGIVDVSEDYDIINFTSNPMADAVVGSYVNIKIDVLNGSMCDSMMIEFINQIKKLTVTENGQYIFTKDEGYNALERVEVEVNIDVDDYYNKGYTEGYSIGVATSYDVGKEDGINEQKSKLAPISITENGTYTNEDGYNEIHVEVPDLNGSYDEGYNDGELAGYDRGYTDGSNDGYANGAQDGYNNGYATGEEIGYNNGVAEGTANAGEIIAETARVLNVTENGIYTSQYSQYEDYLTIPDLVTGVFPDGTNFYNWGDIKNGHFNTNVCPTANSRVEFWWKPAEESKGYHYQNIFGAGLSDNSGPDNFEIHYYSNSRTQMRLKIGNEMAMFTIDNTIWNHILIENGSLYINDELKAQVNTSTYVSDGTPLIINSTPSRYIYNGNGLFGMFKIDDHIFIPSKDGFINYETGQLLTGYIPTDVTKPFDGIYNFVDNFTEVPAEGNLIRTISVNVLPKLKNPEIKFAYSTFSKIPDGLIDWKHIDGMRYMFYQCSKLKDLGDIDTSNVTDMYNAFYACSNLTGDAIKNLDTSNVKNFYYTFASTKLDYFPSLNTSQVTDFSYVFRDVTTMVEVMPIDTSNATTMNSMFYVFGGGQKLQKLPEFDCTNVTNIGSYFAYSGYVDKVPNLTDCGGWKNLKIDWNDGYGLNHCPNLSYQSCINILNGLWDFRNGDNTTTRTLKVHQNFLDLVGDEISIATNKGWTIQV